MIDNIKEKSHDFLCYGCGVKLNTCMCLWGKFRELYEMFTKISERTEELEGYMKMEDRVTASDVLMRLTEIERFQDITHLQYKKKKAPHKCPCCSSVGFVFDITNEHSLPWPNSQKITCTPCEGKGIVWG